MQLERIALGHRHTLLGGSFDSKFLALLLEL